MESGQAEQECNQFCVGCGSCGLDYVPAVFSEVHIMFQLGDIYSRVVWTFLLYTLSYMDAFPTLLTQNIHRNTCKGTG